MRSQPVEPGIWCGTGGEWCAYVETAPDEATQQERLALVPDHLRPLVEDHIHTVKGIAANKWIVYVMQGRNREERRRRLNEVPENKQETVRTEVWQRWNKRQRRRKAA